MAQSEVLRAQAKCQNCLQKVRESAGTFEALGAAAIMAAAIERRTHTRTAITDDIVSKFLHNLRVLKLDIAWDTNSSDSLADHLNSVFAWLTDVLEGNRYFAEQWKALPADWKVRCVLTSTQNTLCPRTSALLF